MSFMLTPHRFSSATLWTPNNLPSLIVWYDGSQETGAHDSVMNTWINRATAGGNDATSPSGDGNKPRLHTNGAGISFPTNVVRFGGLGGAGARPRFTVSISTASVTSASYGAVAWVDADPTSGTDNGPILANYGNTSRWPQTDSKIYDGFGSTTFRDWGNPTPALTSPRLYSVHANTSDHRAYLDGTALNTFGSNTVGFGSGSTRYIGSSEDVANSLEGYIAEIAISHSIWSTDDRQKWEGYVAHKYGLTANLPGGHPYISSPPTV
jgi:hypothetical protein